MVRIHLGSPTKSKGSPVTFGTFSSSGNHLAITAKEASGISG